MSVILLIILLSKYCTVLCMKESSDYTQSQIEVSAAFVNCKLHDNMDTLCDPEVNRYLREPAFRYGSLIDSRKKIILTVKLTGTNADYENEEFIPIEHVYDNGIHDRIRLLDPYVLRMRREPAVQAYKLRHIANVTVILTDQPVSNKLKRKHVKINNKHHRGKFEQNTNESGSDLLDLYHQPSTHHFFPKRNHCDYKIANNLKRKTRQEHNVVIEDPVKKVNNVMKNKHSIKTNEYNDYNNYLTQNDILDIVNVSANDEIKNNTLYDYNENAMQQFPYENNDWYSLNELKPHAELWHSVQLQLLQKTVDQSGKTMWYDLMEGEKMVIGTSSPDCKRSDIAARYRLTSCLNQSQNVLPPGLSLLKKINVFDDKMDDNIIIVPSGDIINIDGENLKDNEEIRSGIRKEAKTVNEYKKVIVRMNRAISISNKKYGDKVVVRGSQSYLTTAHKDKMESQVDIEARADNNEVIYVGSAARITTLVSDATRNTRTILTVHASNTGLAAAHFRAAVRDCEPQALNVVNEANDVVLSERMLLPPRQTRRVQLEILQELPSDSFNCIVSLINDKDESVAVRDVTIKRADRCFCVWHCNCVCLGVDPNLICNELSNSKLAASGISMQGRPRRERCLKYPDNMFLDAMVVMIGVLMLLLFLGIIKACLGICIPQLGMWGLNRVVKLPRHIERYHEPWLRMRRVIHDGNGWPVHPDTKKRTVRLLSWYMEFILNLCFFILLPCLAMRDLFLVCRNKIQNRNIKKASKINDEQMLGPGKIYKKINIKNTKSSPKKGKKFGKLFTRKAKISTIEGQCVCKTEDEDTAYILAQMKNSRNSLTKINLTNKNEKHQKK